MGNRHLRKICAKCKKFRNLAWDKEKTLCHDCLMKNGNANRHNTGVRYGTTESE